MEVLNHYPKEGSLYHSIDKGLKKYLESSVMDTCHSTSSEVEQLGRILKALTMVSLSSRRVLLITVASTHLLMDNISFTFEEILAIFFGLEVSSYNIGKRTPHLELIRVLAKGWRKGQCNSCSIRDEKRSAHLEYRKKYFPWLTREVERWKVNITEPGYVSPDEAVILQGSIGVESETLELLGKTLGEMTQNKRGIEKKIFVMLFPEKSKYFPISMLESVSFFLRIEAVSLPQDLEGISHCIKINPKDLSDINIAMESIDLCGDLRLYIRNIVTAIRKEKLIQVSVPLIREEIEHGAKALAALLGFSFVTPDCVLSVIPNVVIHKFIFKSCSRSIAESREMIFKIINNVELPA